MPAWTLCALRFAYVALSSTAQQAVAACELELCVYAAADLPRFQRALAGADQSAARDEPPWTPSGLILQVSPTLTPLDAADAVELPAADAPDRICPAVLTQTQGGVARDPSLPPYHIDWAAHFSQELQQDGALGAIPPAEASESLRDPRAPLRAPCIPEVIGMLAPQSSLGDPDAAHAGPAPVSPSSAPDALPGEPEVPAVAAGSPPPPGGDVLIGPSATLAPVGVVPTDAASGDAASSAAPLPPVALVGEREAYA